MDVILVNPPHSFMETHRGGRKNQKELLSYPPLGILYLASVLEKERVKVKIIDSPARGDSVKDVVQIIEKEEPSIVGISATTPQARTAVHLAKTLRKRFENTLIIGLGGAHISADPNFIKHFPYFDFGLTGEGEITFPKIVKKILGGKKVKGVYHGEACANLDDIPFPARHLINNELYFMPIHAKRFTSIIASRGCPYNCLYCSHPVIGKKVRYRSPDNVVAEMEDCIQKHEIEWFQFVDDTVTINRHHTLRLCKEIINRRLNIGWGCQTRIDLVDETLLKIMHEVGCREISFGVESGSERIRSILRKYFSNKSVFKAFKLCRKIGIETNAFFMLGLPTETKEELYQTVNFGRKIDADYIQVHVVTPFPGSDLFEPAKNEGVISSDIWDRYTKGKSENNLPLYIPSSLAHKELLEAQKQAYKKFYFRVPYIFRRLSRDILSIKKLKRDLASALALMGRGSK